MLEVAGWILTVGGAIAFLIAAIRSFLKWPETEAISLSTVDGIADCQLRVKNDAFTHIKVERIVALWPREMKIGRRRYGTSAHPWEPGPELPPDWTTSLTEGCIVSPGSTAVVSFVLRDPRTSARSQRLLIKFASARFITRISWKHVTVFNAATPMNTIA